MLAAPRGGRASTAARSRAPPRCPARSASRDEAPEVVERAQLGVRWRCGRPSADADGPRAAGVVGAGAERVVGALAVGDADRVDRRQVDDVEAHLGDRRQALGRAGETALAAGEQLVPGAVAGPRAVDPQRAWPTVVTSASGTPATSSATWSSSPAFSRTCSVQDVRRRAVTASSTRRAARAPRPAASCSRRRAPSSSSSSTSSPAAALISIVVAPGGEAVAPGLDHELVAADVGRAHLALPPVVHDRPQRGARPLALPSRRQRTRAARRSWPSWKMSAETVTRSPTTALAGKSPVGVVGRTASMVMRPSTPQHYAAAAPTKPTIPLTAGPGPPARPGRPGSAAANGAARRRSSAGPSARSARPSRRRADRSRPPTCR